MAAEPRPALMRQLTPRPHGEEPIEVGAADLEAMPTPMHVPPTVPKAGPALSDASQPALTPSSGLGATEEWLGHLLLGYAPFQVPVTRRAVGAEPAANGKPKGADQTGS